MDSKWMKILGEFEIVLASASPRRREILGSLGLSKFQVVPSQFEETLDKTTFRSAAEYVTTNALEKGRDVAVRLHGGTKNLLVLSADTVVVLPEELIHQTQHKYPLGILEKPQSQDEAKEFCKMLSGRTHEVVTGLSITYFSHRKQQMIERTKTTSTKVTFRKLNDEQIRSYVETSEPYDKAGGYGIQAAAKWFIQSINGCYYNVVGLPTSDLLDLLCDVARDLSPTQHDLQ